MFRLSHYLTNCVSRRRSARRASRRDGGDLEPDPALQPDCKHCYSISGDVDFPANCRRGSLSVMDDLKAFRVPVLILSGGEPLMRRDIFEISQRAQGHEVLCRPLQQRHPGGCAARRPHPGRRLRLCRDFARRHRRYPRPFSPQGGAYDEALNGLRLLRDRGIKVGVRFTMTEDNARNCPACSIWWSARAFTSSICRISSMRPRQQEPRRRRDLADTRDTMDM